MLDILIKHFFIFLICIIMHQHISILSFHFNLSLQIILAILLSFTTCLFRMFFPSLANVFPFIILWIILSLISSHPQYIFVTLTFSFGLSYGFFLLSGAFLLAIITPFYHSITNVSNFILLPLTGILEIFIVQILFRIKRFKKGMPFLTSMKFINSGTIICFSFLLVITYMQTSSFSDIWLDTIFAFLLLLSLAALIFWWQAQLTKSYLHKLQLLELESLRKELEETTNEMEHLKKQNEELGRLIHKDNKLIPALETAVTDFLSADGDEKNKAMGASLILQLKELSGSRREILDEVSAARSRHFATGIPALDTLLDYFDRRAEARKMEFTVNIAPNLAAYVPSKISSEDITHLLADLLENAIIAVAPCASRKIRLQIYPYRKWFVIELSDTGIPFQEKSLLQFGIQQLTTHESSGGSGIGLMDIWKLKEKYHASIHITEYRDTAPFSKRITFLLDHRNQYLIRTWRFEELRTKSRRADLCILPPGDEVSSSEKKEGRHTE